MTLPPRRSGFLATLSALSVLSVLAGGLLAPAATGAPAAPAATGTTAATVAAVTPEPRSYSAPAVPAATLVDSVGVNVHLHYYDTAYNRYDDLVKPRLLELGVRHVRDAAYTYDGIGADSTYYRRVRDLAASGVEFNLSTGMRTNWGGQRTVFSKLADVQRWSGGAVESFEGVNEPDLQNVAGWVGETRAIQQELAQTVRSTPSLSGVQVIGPSLTTEEAAVAVGDLGAYSDYGNLHNYPSDRAPETGGWGDNGYGSLGWNLSRMAGRLASGKPVVTTETGFYTAPIDDNGISERAAGGYTPRLLLNQLAGGVRRTYLYEFLRQRNDAGDREANFGLVRADGSRTPSYLAVRSLIDLVQSTGPTPAPGSPTTLRWDVAGDTAGLHQMPIRLGSGEYVLALWTDESLWDTGRDHDLAPADRALDVTPPSGLEVTGVVKQAASGEFAEQAVRGRTARVAVGPRLTFLRLGSDTTPGDATWTDPALGGAVPGAPISRPAGTAPSGPKVRVQGHGTDRGRDVRAGRGALKGAAIARTADLRKATATVSGGTVRFRVSTAGGRLTRRDTATYTIRAGRSAPLVRWSSRAAAPSAAGACAATARRHSSGKVTDLTVSTRCLPKGSQVAVTVVASVRRQTARGAHWWVDSMKGPSLRVS